MTSLMLVLAPLLALVERSFTSASGYTLQHYSGLETNDQGRVFFVSLSEAIKNSVGFAGATMLIAVPLGTMIAFGLARGRGRLGAKRVVLASNLAPLPISARSTAEVSDCPFQSC